MNPAPPFAVAVCGIEELAGHGTLGATHVLSILDPDHPVPEAFGTFGEHAKLELRFHDIVDPRPGEIVPSRAHVFAWRVLAMPDPTALRCASMGSRSGQPPFPELDRFAVLPWNEAVERVGRNMARVLALVRARLAP